MMTFYLFRHAEVEEKYQQRYRGGRLDCDLSEQGKQDSEIMAQFLVQKKVGVVVTSGLKRTDYVGTLVAQHGIKHVIDRRLREIDMGTWDGKLGIPEGELFDLLVSGVLFPEGENLTDVFQRVRAAWTDIERQQLQRMAIIGHSISNAVLLSMLLKKDFLEVRSPPMSHYHELTITDEKVEIVRENVSVV